jgi:hypothetical protein
MLLHRDIRLDSHNTVQIIPENRHILSKACRAAAVPQPTRPGKLST